MRKQFSLYSFPYFVFFFWFFHFISFTYEQMPHCIFLFIDVHWNVCANMAANILFAMRFYWIVVIFLCSQYYQLLQFVFLLVQLVVSVIVFVMALFMKCTVNKAFQMSRVFQQLLPQFVIFCFLFVFQTNLVCLIKLCLFFFVFVTWKHENRL